MGASWTSGSDRGGPAPHEATRWLHHDDRRHRDGLQEPDQHVTQGRRRGRGVRDLAQPEAVPGPDVAVPDPLEAQTWHPAKLPPQPGGSGRRPVVVVAPLPIARVQRRGRRRQALAEIAALGEEVLDPHPFGLQSHGAHRTAPAKAQSATGMIADGILASSEACAIRARAREKPEKNAGRTRKCRSHPKCRSQPVALGRPPRIRLLAHSGAAVAISRRTAAKASPFRARAVSPATTRKSRAGCRVAETSTLGGRSRSTPSAWSKDGVGVRVGPLGDEGAQLPPGFYDPGTELIRRQSSRPSAEPAGVSGDAGSPSSSWMPGALIADPPRAASQRRLPDQRRRSGADDQWKRISARRCRQGRVECDWIHRCVVPLRHTRQATSGLY